MLTVYMVRVNRNSAILSCPNFVGLCEQFSIISIYLSLTHSLFQLWSILSSRLSYRAGWGLVRDDCYGWLGFGKSLVRVSWCPARCSEGWFNSSLIEHYYYLWDFCTTEVYNDGRHLAQQIHRRTTGPDSLETIDFWKLTWLDWSEGMRTR